TLPQAFQNALTSGTSYYIVSLSTDLAGNPEFGPLATDIPGGVGFTVIYDSSMPTALINLPGNVPAINSLPAISGITQDDNPHVPAISKVEIAIQRWSDNKYFTNTTWIAGVQWKDVSVAGGGSSLSPNATSWIYSPAA